MKKVFLLIGACVFALALIAGVAFSIVMSNKIYSKVKEESKLAQQERDATNAEKAKLAAENADTENVAISGGYKIEPTTKVSDAYKSGDSSSLNDRDKKTLELASAVLKDIIKDDMTNYEKELAVYEWMVKNIKFEMNSFVAVPAALGESDNPFGVLQGKSAVCAGFATTFRLFMQMMDIECKVVHDTEASHSWDLVKLDNEWYHVDCTFDSSSESSYYQSFNLDDAAAQQSHSWDTTLFPSATGKKYSYASQQAKEDLDLYKLPQKVKTIIDKKTKRSFFKIDSKYKPSQVDYILTAIQSNMSDMSLTYSFYTYDDKKFIIGLFLCNNENVDSDAFTKDELTKLGNIFKEIFGEDYTQTMYAEPEK